MKELKSLVLGLDTLVEVPDFVGEERVEGVIGSSDPVWNKGTPMPVDYTCCCGMYVHPSRRNPNGIHLEDCPYRIPIVHDELKSSNFLDRFGPFEG